MQLKLVAPLTALRDAQADLKRTAVAVSAQEKVNLKKLATVYEKMDPVKCAKTITEMCVGSQEDDAAKIIHFMSEKGAAKLLAEITDKGVAAGLTMKLKCIQEDAPPPSEEK